jgi:copper chaperone CopZ
MRLQEIVIEIAGLSGPDAEGIVAAALRTVPGVRTVQVDAREQRAIVTGDPNVAVSEALRAAIQSAGLSAGDIWFAE